MVGVKGVKNESEKKRKKMKGRDKRKTLPKIEYFKGVKEMGTRGVPGLSMLQEKPSLERANESLKGKVKCIQYIESKTSRGVGWVEFGNGP